MFFFVFAPCPPPQMINGRPISTFGAQIKKRPLIMFPSIIIVATPSVKNVRVQQQNYSENDSRESVFH